MVKVSELVKITNADLLGDENFEVTGIARQPEEAKPGELALIFDDKAIKAKAKLASCKASVIFLAEAIKENKEIYQDKEAHILFVKRPRYALKQIMDLFAKQRTYPDSGIHPTAVIDETANVDSSAAIGPYVCIGPNTSIGANTKIFARVTIGANVQLGSDCILRSGVVIEDYSELGSRVIIHPNTVIGSDGYSYVTAEPSNLEKMRSGDFDLNFERQTQEKITAAGNVVIGDDVEIGANTSIDRGTVGSTIIGDGTKIDNLCQIAHNVEIGKDCLIIANVGIAGSAKIGDRVTMAGGSGCGDGVKLGNDVVVAAYSPVNSDVGPFRPVIGAPAVDYAEFMKRQRVYVRLPKLQEEVKDLKRKIKKLETGQVNNGG